MTVCYSERINNMDGQYITNLLEHASFASALWAHYWVCLVHFEVKRTDKAGRSSAVAALQLNMSDPAGRP